MNVCRKNEYRFSIQYCRSLRRLIFKILKCQKEWCVLKEDLAGKGPAFFPEVF
jgi:hypothetical protein